MAKFPKYGHAPGHVRDAACDAFEAWMDWDGELPEPTIEYEIHYVPHRIPISRACGLVWNCTDIVGGLVFDRLRDELEAAGQTIKSCTFGASARAILEDIKKRRAIAA
jgi:hypothetical protein